MKPIHITTPSSTLLARVKTMVPPMLEKFHKGTPTRWHHQEQVIDKMAGQLGRVAVIGGSAE